MTTPPPPDPRDPERVADAALYRSFVDLGERETVETERVRSPRRRRRRRVVRQALLTAGAFVVLGGAALATRAILPGDGPVKSDRKPAEDIVPADRRFGAARARDPRNGTVWGVRLYYNKAGDACALVGAVDHGRLGRIRDGRFSQLPEQATGVCHDMADHVFITYRTYTDTSEPRTVVYGLADRSIASLELKTRDGKRRRIAIAPDGSYVLPLAGRQPLAGATLTVRTPQQTTVRKLKTEPPPATLPTP
jgi:hypothetical protein